MLACSARNARKEEIQPSSIQKHDDDPRPKSNLQITIEKDQDMLRFFVFLLTPWVTTSWTASMWRQNAQMPLKQYQSRRPRASHSSAGGSVNRYLDVNSGPRSCSSLRMQMASSSETAAVGYVKPGEVVFPDGMSDEWELDCYSRPVMGGK